MKTIIISDIFSKKESIIPYGLNLAKTLETEVDVLHVIDPRMNQGEYSSFSDSQSITPGHTMNHDEIVQRERNKADIALDKLLSSEASRLNYPLKVNTDVEENTIIDAIQTKLEQEPSALVIVSSEPDGYIFQSKDEIINTFENTGALGLIVPPEQSFQMINKVVFPVDFKSEDFGAYAKIHAFIRHFTPVIDAVGFEKNDKDSLEQESENWLEIAQSSFVPSTVKTNLLKGENFANALNDYIENIQPDILILLGHKQNALKSIFKRNEAKVLLPQINLPVLIHFQNE